MRKKKRGAALVIVVLTMSILFILGTTMLSVANFSYKSRIRESNRIRNLYGADSGVNVVENIINLPESNTLDDVYSVWYMLDKLASNNTNSYIKQEFKDYMAFFPDIEELITGIITKDLNLGMSIVSINKILKVLDLDSSQLAISNWFHK